MQSQNIGFNTPGGLKIRLNHRYFFCQLIKPDRYYTEDETANDDTMYNATANIETMYMIPTMLIQVFSIFAVIFDMGVSIFCIGMFLLYTFGCIWRCLKQDFLLSTILMFFSTLYKMLWWLCFAALIILIFVSKNIYFILPYLGMRLVLFIFSCIENHIVATHTMKKYGIPFNNTEICAFRVFHLLSESELKLSDYINQYVSAINKEESEAMK